MRTTPRILIQLVPSRWQQRVSNCCALLIGVAITLILHDLALIQTWFLSAALAAIASLVFALLARQQNVNLGTDRLRLILAQDKQLWIGQESAPPADLALPELSKLQRYLGLIWLSNSNGAQALIWPDSISADEHRLLRVWLGIHAHRKS